MPQKNAVKTPLLIKFCETAKFHNLASWDLGIIINAGLSYKKWRMFSQDVTDGFLAKIKIISITKSYWPLQCHAKSYAHNYSSLAQL